MKTSTAFFLMLVVMSTLLVAGCTQQTVQPTPQPTAIPTTTATDTVRLMDTTLGMVLTDSRGMTLYFFITDIPASGGSTCYAAANCTHFWPIFNTDTIRVSPPLSAADFSSITRTDGTKQTAYRGWPLYYFLNDKVPGDVRGENVLKTWYVAKQDYTVMIASTPQAGAFLTDQLGRTLYTFNQDRTGTSTCTGTCIATWPAFSAGAIVAPSVLKPSDFTTVTRADGAKQWAFMGKPLYYYTGDSGPGMTTGQGFMNKWYVANVTGFLPAAPATVPATTLTTIPAMNYGSGGGGGY